MALGLCARGSAGVADGGRSPQFSVVWLTRAFAPSRPDRQSTCLLHPSSAQSQSTKPSDLRITRNPYRQGTGRRFVPQSICTSNLFPPQGGSSGEARTSGDYQITYYVHTAPRGETHHFHRSRITASGRYRSSLMQQYFRIIRRSSHLISTRGDILC